MLGSGAQEQRPSGASAGDEAGLRALERRLKVLGLFSRLGGAKPWLPPSGRVRASRGLGGQKGAERGALGPG